MENILSELLEQVQPAEDSLVRIWSQLGEATLQAEQGRLRERFLELAGKVISINELLEKT